MIKTNEEEEIAKRDHEEKLRQNAQIYSEEQFIEELRLQRKTTSLSPEIEEFIQRSRTREESEEQEKEAAIPSEIHMMKEEVVRVYKPKAPYPQRLLRVTKEHANSLPKGSIQHHAEEREEVN
ncbi:hypothetical protein AHAS_Ahas20G0198700 [Arachis hypogaea]